MNIMQRKVKDFHEMFGVEAPARMTFPQPEVVMLRARLMQEELNEWAVSMQEGDYKNAIKELADLLYVTFGTAVSMGVDIQPFFDEVHISNTTKLWPDGMVHKDAGGKVLKSPMYKKADISKIYNDVLSAEFEAHAYDASGSHETSDERE